MLWVGIIIKQKDESLYKEPETQSYQKRHYTEWILHDKNFPPFAQDKKHLRSILDMFKEIEVL